MRVDKAGNAGFACVLTFLKCGLDGHRLARWPGAGPVIVSQIARSHDGTMDVTSSDGNICFVLKVQERDDQRVRWRRLGAGVASPVGATPGQSTAYCAAADTPSAEFSSSGIG